MAWLIVAAEKRELSGLVRRGPESKWICIANGPGARLATEALRERRDVEGIVSTGFCGALDPSLRIGDIVVSGAGVTSARPFTRGLILSLDRVAATAAEKSFLRDRTGAVAVEMEAAAVEAKAREWGVPFRCVKAVSDTAGEDMPLDFNLYRDRQGRFSRARIACAALRRPFTLVPALRRLDANCRIAAEKLGEFIADCTL